jgi:hypothetical protein
LMTGVGRPEPSRHYPRKAKQERNVRRAVNMCALRSSFKWRRLAGVDVEEPQGTYQMNRNVMLTVVSLFTLLLLTFHLADDIVRGFEPGGLNNLVGGVLISVIWLYGALVLAGRRSGYIIILIGSLLGLFVPYVHMRGRGVGVASGIANSSGGFFFVWTLLALGVAALFSVILSAHGLWSLPWRRSRQSDNPNT